MNIIESLLNTNIANTTITMGTVLISIAAAMLLGLIISITYIRTGKNTHSTTLAVTLFLLPALISSIVMLIGNNLAGAFSLAGIFSVIRFRSAPGSARDIVFILFCVGAGLACGVEAYWYGAILTVILCLAITVLGKAGFTKPKSSRMQLKILVPEDFNNEEIFDDVLTQYTRSFSLEKIRTKDLGSVYELSYYLDIQPDANRKEMIDTLRCRNGNLNITLCSRESANEF